MIICCYTFPLFSTRPIAVVFIFQLQKIERNVLFCVSTQAECRKVLGLIKEHKLTEKGKLRWLVAQTNRVRNGEIYRVVADSRGAFVQPALYEVRYRIKSLWYCDAALHWCHFM